MVYEPEYKIYGPEQLEKDRKMSFDLRIPMGSMFALMGLILTAFGTVSSGREAVYASSLGIDVNLWWGPVLLIFGLILLLSERRARKRLQIASTKPEKKGKTQRVR